MPWFGYRITNGTFSVYAVNEEAANAMVEDMESFFIPRRATFDFLDVERTPEADED